MIAASARKTSAATGKMPKIFADVAAKKLLDLVGRHHGAAVVHHQREALEHRECAERHDDRGQAERHRRGGR